MTRTVLLVAVLAVCAAVVLVVREHAVTGHPLPVARSTQVSFDPVARVPRCADYVGTGPVPAEGHAALFIQPPDATTMYFAVELRFDDLGWVAEDVIVGEETDGRHFTLHVYAVSAWFLRWLELLPPHHLIDRLPTRHLDSLIAIRTDDADTC
ncbi:hypothetical protein [Actinophytocola sp. NPDC049390]|uniref:hypothetical protein n=1 Tax=Actinophytocola sp. NPDC049390 TaxID=3363894 RepID=UPI0037A551CF